MAIGRWLNPLLLMVGLLLSGGAQAQNILILTTGAFNQRSTDEENNYMPKVVREFSAFTDTTIAAPTACAPTTVTGVDPTTGKTKVVTCDQYSLVNTRLNPARPAMTSAIFDQGYDLLVVIAAYTDIDADAWTVIKDAIKTRKVRGVVMMVDTASPENSKEIAGILNSALAVGGVALSPPIAEGASPGSSTYFHSLNSNASAASYFAGLESLALNDGYKVYNNVPSLNALYVNPANAAASKPVAITTATVSAPATFISHAQSYDGKGACFFGASDIGWVNQTSAWNNNAGKLASSFYKAFDTSAASGGLCAQPIAAPPTLSIAKSTTADTRTLPLDGASILYTITVTNTSPTAVALNVGVADAPPAGMHFPNAWTCAPSAPAGVTAPVCPASLTDPAAADGGLKTSIGQMAAGTSMTFTTTAQVVDNQLSLKNVAVLTPPVGGTCDGAGANPCESVVDFPPSVVPVVSITKTTSVSVTKTPINGSTVPFAITVSNTSNTTKASNLTLSDLVPVGMGFGAWTCTVKTSGTPAAVCPGVLPTSGALSGLVIPMLTPGAVLEFGVVATVADNKQSLTNTATLTTAGGATCVGGATSCSATVSFPAPLPATVQVDKATTSDTSKLPAKDALIPYTVRVSNLSATTSADGIQLSDPQPAGLAFGAWSCRVVTPGLPAVTCPAGLPSAGALNVSLAKLSAGSALEFAVTATVTDASAELTNIASLALSADVLCKDGVTPCASVVKFGQAEPNVSPAPIPTLGQWALLLLSVLMGAAYYVLVNRQARSF